MMGMLGDWQKRIKIVIDHTKIDSDLTHFPVPLILGASVGQGNDDVTCVFDEIGANKKKIAVTKADGTTQIYVEIEHWDEISEKAVLWVSRSNLVLSAAASTTLYLYYDANQPDNDTYVGTVTETPAQNVWDAYFAAVYHMAQDPNGDAANAIKDSTSNGNHGTPSGSMTTADLVDGQIGKAIDFDGSDDYLNMGTDTSLNPTTALTHEALFKTSSTAQLQTLTAKFNQNLGTSYYKTELHINTDQSIASNIYDSGGSNNVNCNTNSGTGGSFCDGNFHYAAVKIDIGGDKYARLYTDGALNVTSSGTINSLNDIASVPTTIGERYNSTPVTRMLGIIDEVRISKVARSAAWIKATHHSLKDDLVTWGDEEVTHLKDVSLNLAAYYQKMEDLGAFLRAHDGIELRDLQAILAAFHESEKDLPAWLAAYFEGIDDLGVDLEAWATGYRDLAAALDVKGQALESLAAWLHAARASLADISAFLAASDGIVTNDVGTFLAATDGTVLNDMGVHLKVIQSIPAFRSITAQRVSSVVQEVT